LIRSLSGPSPSARPELIRCRQIHLKPQCSTSGPVTSSFAYDGFGRRRSKTIGATTTQFLYDRPNPVQELSSGTPTAYLLTGLGIDEFFTRTDSGGEGTYLTDALGSSVALADGSGTVQTEYTYEPFGGTMTSGASTSNSLAYTGREADGTGLYYYRARYYHAGTQRFTAEDPLGAAGRTSSCDRASFTVSYDADVALAPVVRSALSGS
jgi:RHS repeat-associated protein